MNEISFTVPMVPPGVNNYVRHTRAGRHYVTKEAKAFKEAFIYFRPPETLPALDAYEVEVRVYRGKGQKGDVDNYSKCVLDGMVEAGIIVSDDRVTDLILRKRRDPANPRTEITVRSA